MARSFLAVCVALMVAGCGGGGGGGNGAVQPDPVQPPAPPPAAETIQELEDSGAIPKLERGNTLSGTDADRNGVRDDIDAYITKNYPQGAPRQAATQFAKVLQRALLVDLNDNAALKDLSIKMARACNCIYQKFPADSRQGVIEEIEAITSNTETRLNAYLAFNRALDGTTTAIPEGDTCE
jgi:hypothetical protein